MDYQPIPNTTGVTADTVTRWLYRADQGSVLARTVSRAWYGVLIQKAGQQKAEKALQDRGVVVPDWLSEAAAE